MSLQETIKIASGETVFTVILSGKPPPISPLKPKWATGQKALFAGAGTMRLAASRSVIMWHMNIKSK